MVSLAGAAVLTAAASAHAGAPLWTIGYSTPAALHGLDVVRIVPALRIAVVRGRAPHRAGIRFADRAAARTATAEPAVATIVGHGLPLEWQYDAVHETAVPDWVLRAAAAVTVAVVDTGADLSAPDLAAKHPAAYNVRTGTANVRDTNGHGTFVAGLAAGSVTNGDGISGFGGDAKLLVIKAGSANGAFTDVDEASAIVYAVDHGARIVNLSIGGKTTSRAERDALEYAAEHGVLVVAAAGNERGAGDPAEYPAALLQPLGSNGEGGTGLAVAASTQGGGHAPFSNEGSYISLAAPGDNVFGAVARLSRGRAYPRVPLPGSLAGLYGFASGTSFAAPEVAGAAALVWAANPLLTAAQVADILKQTASGNGSWNRSLGYGVIDVAAAVAAASGHPSVELSGARDPLGVRLRWRVFGQAAAFRVSVSRDGGPVQVVYGPTTETSTSLALTAGHRYAFTVDALDAQGAVAGSSQPFGVARPLR
jgi:subtilisin family serine protease